jgi:hypothetical protein
MQSLMNPTFNRLFLLPALLSGVLLSGSGCGGSDKPAGDGNQTDTLIQNQADSLQSFFQIPMPGEFYGNLRKLGLKAKPGLLNPVENVASYTGSKEKSINFGVYSSDLFYSSNFDLKADVLKIFNNLRKLAGEMGIASVLSEELLKRTEKNLGNKDSLNAITSEVFFDASSNLEKNGQGASLALVIAGGFVESLYISTNLAETEKEGGAVFQYIADQKYPLENLFHYLDKYGSDARVSEVKVAMEPLKNVFASIKEEQVTQGKTESGKRIIGATSRLVLTNAQFKELKDVSTRIRNEFTLNQVSK